MIKFRVGERVKVVEVREPYDEVSRELVGEEGYVLKVDDLNRHETYYQVRVESQETPVWMKAVELRRVFLIREYVDGDDPFDYVTRLAFAAMGGIDTDGSHHKDEALWEIIEMLGYDVVDAKAKLEVEQNRE